MRTQTLTVAMNGEVVGTLYRDNRGAMSFQYAPEWVLEPGSRAISLSLPLGHSRLKGSEVFNFFSNLLPDSEAIIARMQARFRVDTTHPFDLLASVGRDCVGAIQLSSPDAEIPTVMETLAEPLDEAQIEQLLEGYQEAPLGMAEDADFRISIAGAQEKTALLWYQDCWQRPLGSTPTSHIFKLPIGRIVQNNIDLSESCENEWLCLRIAKAFGFEVANADLATFGNKKVLVVQRFDRRWSRSGEWLLRLPQEDFCQALGISPALKYESHGGPGIADAMKLLLGSRLAAKDREQFFKSQILFWMLAAIDGHGKNFSIFIEPASSFRMTPLYDVMSAFPIFKSGGIAAQKAKMGMALQGKNRQYHFVKIQPRHFISTAAHVGFSQDAAAQLMLDMATKTAAVVATVAAELPAGFPEHISNAIFDGLSSQAAKILKGVAK
ncbi:type II toxin-antitoxin system HipA family toxin [Aeromonas caviae]|uniref:type II toxin-antitoxin system HipA family toxin n=1 Tax=Aeromonas salmonicida TaxID=645 RepID=UPI001F1A8148|nr:type II toxin-antitoxin system HipA family toxin [Aeromonas salmonicida]MCE9934796.1 type II toxin-antitoxin system HipA family toxin [Aeromonas salmonicida]MDH0436344.1 type II toxin-antitoxin system HipA family toxin [Aeromonas caviae]